LHSGAPDAAQVAKEAGVGRLALVHCARSNQAAALQAAQQIFANTFWPADGETVVLETWRDMNRRSSITTSASGAGLGVVSGEAQAAPRRAEGGGMDNGNRKQALDLRRYTFAPPDRAASPPNPAR
jgi:Tfp pilus assembly protein PilX